jgi:hypothetical protein
METDPVSKMFPDLKTLDDGRIAKTKNSKDTRSFAIV